MPVKELTGFLGVNLRRDRLSLEDFELAKAVNVDMASVLGAIRIRQGDRGQFQTALADMFVRRLARIAERRYRVAGSSIYREETNIMMGSLSRNERTTIVPFRPLLDSNNWAFFADDAVMKKDDGSRFYEWGIAQPLSIPAAVLGIGSGLKGGYSYRYTYCRMDDLKVAHESNPSAPSEGITADDNDIAVGNMLHPVDPQVDAIGIYRTVAGGAAHFLEARLEIPAEHRFAVTHLFEATALPATELIHHFTQNPLIAGSTSITRLGRNFPGAIVNDGSFGTKTWENPIRAKEPDGKFATRKASVSPAVISNYLKATKFGFNVPTGATISGIEVAIKRFKSGTGSVTDERVRIVKGGAIGSTEKAVADEWPTEATYQTYGGTTDLWGETWTAADLNAENFGVVLSVDQDNSGNFVQANVDTITIKVFITASTTVGESLIAVHDWEPQGSKDTIDPRGRRVTHRWEIDAGYAAVQQIVWAFNSQEPDTGLGALVLTDNDLPPKADFACVHQEHVFLLGDDENPHYLYWSKRFEPEAFPLLNYVEIGNASDPLQGMVSLGGLLGVFSRQTKYRVLGDSGQGFVHQESLSKRGTRSPYSITAWEKGVVFVADDGVYNTSFVSEDEKLSQEIEPLFNNLTVNDYEPINLGSPARISTAFYKNRIYMAYPSGEKSDPRMLAVYSLDTLKWYFWDLGLASLYVEAEDGSLTAGGTNGFAYVLEDGLTHAGESISMTVETKDIVGDSPNVRKFFRSFRPDIDADGDSVTVEVLVDGRSAGSFAISGNREKAVRRLAGILGYSARMKITYTGKRRPVVYGALLDFESLSPGP